MKTEVHNIQIIDNIGNTNTSQILTNATPRINHINEVIL